MVIVVDLRSMPPLVTLDEPDDFKAFKIVTRGTHGFVDAAAIERLAGTRADDAEWRDGLAKMVSYAESRGWTDDTGALRAHIEHER
jgi:hypothetical protein